MLERVQLFVDIVSGLAVVVSLLYVGIQIRQNTRAARLASVQAVQAAIGRTEELIIADAGFAAILHKGLTAPASNLADADRIRLNVFYRHTLRTFQSAHYQYRMHALDASVWEAQCRALGAIFHADRGLRDHFAVEKYMLEPAFVACCEGLLQQASAGAITSASEPTEPGG